MSALPLLESSIVTEKVHIACMFPSYSQQGGLSTLACHEVNFKIQSCLPVVQSVKTHQDRKRRYLAERGRKTLDLSLCFFHDQMSTSTVFDTLEILIPFKDFSFSVLQSYLKIRVFRLNSCMCRKLVHTEG